jgi:hypothetical protein
MGESQTNLARSPNSTQQVEQPATPSVELTRAQRWGNAALGCIGAWVSAGVGIFLGVRANTKAGALVATLISLFIAATLCEYGIANRRRGFVSGLLVGLGIAIATLLVVALLHQHGEA